MDGTCDDHHSLCLWKYENPAPCSGAVIRTHRTQEQNGCTSKRTEQGRKSPAANVGFNVSSSTRTFKRHLTILLLTASFLQKFPLHHQGPNRAHSPHHPQSSYLGRLSLSRTGTAELSGPTPSNRNRFLADCATPATTWFRLKWLSGSLPASRPNRALSLNPSQRDLTREDGIC
jgi:hypothetical protein